MSRELFKRAVAALMAQLVLAPALHAGTVFVESSLERLFTGAHAAEGPAPHPDGSVYFTDITSTVDHDGNVPGRLWRHNVVSGETTLFLPNAGQPNGMVVDDAGKLVVAQAADRGGRRIVRVDPVTKKTMLLAGLYRDRPFNAPNDVAIDKQGRLFFTDPRYVGHEPIEQDAFGVYRIDPDGTVTRLIDDLEGPNGIAIHPDGGTLYVTEYDPGFHDPESRRHAAARSEKGDMKLMAYDIDSHGAVSSPRTIVDFGDRYGMDGLAVDSAGRIFGAVRDDARFGVAVYSPSGEELDFLPLPEKPSNVAFGITPGDRDAIYVTTRTSLYRARLHGKRDYHGWGSYGGAPDFTRYSALDQINRSNVSRLEVAWTFDTGDTAENSELQITPLLLNGRLYVASPRMRIFALDPATGEELWHFEPDIPAGPPARRRNRGFAAWSGDNTARIFIAIDHELLALDAETGIPVKEFGRNGVVDLREGLGRDIDRIEVGANTPGAVFGNLLIMGSIVSEIYPAAPGDVRAYDVRTGEIVWTFHTVPRPGEFGHETWPDDAHEYMGGANTWSGISLDEKRGLAIFGTGSPAYDFYGGNRPGANLFSDSIVALDARTGKRVWHYQVIPHDVWDRDMPSAPTLATIDKDGVPLDVVIAATKQGHVYVLDRETGVPIHPMEDLAVPSSTLPGETTPETISVPIKPAPIARTVFTPDIITRRTQAAHDDVVRRLEGMRYDGLFTPPSLEGTLFLPDYAGASTWGGGAFDPETGLYYINARENAAVVQMVEKPDLDAVASASQLYSARCASCHGPQRKGSNDVPDITGVGLRQRHDPGTLAAFIANGRGLMPGFESVIPQTTIKALADYLLYGADDPIEPGTETGGRERLPYVMNGFQYLFDPDGYPIIEPPWGTMNAIDIATGDYVWKRPLGAYPELKDTLGETGTLNYGGPVATGGGLVFIAATLFDNKIRAFHSETGEVLWEADLPTAGVATPAVYEAHGRQFLVIAAGGGKFGAAPGGTYVAFALPWHAVNK